MAEQVWAEANYDNYQKMRSQNCQASSNPLLIRPNQLALQPHDTQLQPHLNQREGLYRSFPGCSVLNVLSSAETASLPLASFDLTLK